jgi:hypothetical protein
LISLGILAPTLGCTNAKLDLGGTSSSGPPPASTAPPGPPAGDVSGVVISSLGVPVSNVSLLSGGVVTTTDAQGRFTIRSAPAQYDVAIAMQYPPYDPNASGFHGVSLYQGLSTRTPILTAQVWAANTSGATVHLTYPALPAGAQDVVVGDIASRGTFSLWGGQPYILAMPSNDVTFSMLGSGPAVDSKLGWLAYTVTTDADGDQHPDHYLDFDRTEMTLAPGSTTAWTPHAGDVAEQTVTGAPACDPTQTVYEAYPLMRLSSAGAWAPITVSPVRAAPWALRVPKIPGVQVAIHYTAYDTGSPGSAGGSESDAVVLVDDDGDMAPAVLPPPPRLVAPDDGAPFGPTTGTTLRWEAPGTCMVHVGAGEQGGTAYFAWLVVFTRAGAFTMPDLSALGVTLPDGVAYTWGVSCVQTSEPGLGGDPLLLPPGDLLGTSGSTSNNTQRTLVSAP